MGLVARSRTKVLVASAMVVVFGMGLAACDSGSEETDQQIADLEQQLDDSQAALDASEAENADLQAEVESTQTQLADTQADLEAAQARQRSTRQELTTTQEELASTEVELLDAQAQLAQVGELLLPDGTYTGQVLGAKASPRVIVFNAAGNFRAAEVASNATITSGGQTLTLQQLGRLLSSTNPDDAELANGNYRVIVSKGLVTSIRKSQS